MEDSIGTKLSSRSAKANKVIPLCLSDSRQKKLKKKRKGRRNSNKTEDITKQGTRLTDEDKEPLEVEGIAALDNDSEESSSMKGEPVSGGTTKLPLIASINIGIARTQVDNTERSPETFNGDTLRQTALVNSLAHKINSLSIKPRSNGASRANPSLRGNKQNPSKVAKHRNGKDKGNSSPAIKSAPAGIKTTPTNAFARGAIVEAIKTSNYNNSFISQESLRWEHVLDDSEEERERIRIYKINRRKRYLAAAQAKGLGWALKQSFQIADEYGLDGRGWGATASISGPTQTSYQVQATDFTPMMSLRASGGHGMMGATMVEC